MRKLLWLIPLFFLTPALGAILDWYWWFATGGRLLEDWTEARAITVVFSFVMGLLTTGLIADAHP